MQGMAQLKLARFFEETLEAEAEIFGDRYGADFEKQAQNGRETLGALCLHPRRRLQKQCWM